MIALALPPFWSLVEPHGDELLAHARRMAGDQHAEDVLQDALLRALRAYPRLRHAEHLRAWLYRVTTTAAIDAHRSRRRELPTDDVPAVATQDTYDEGAFEALIAPLPGRRAEPLRLRFVDDLDYEGIADRLGISPSGRAPARVDRRPHPPREARRMTPLPDTLLEAVAAAAVREGLADAVFTRLRTPIGRLLVVQGRSGIVRVGFEEEPEDRVLAEVAAGLGPRIVASDRELAATRDTLDGLLRGRGRPARAAGRPDARRRAVPARVLETLHDTVPPRRGRHLRRAGRARRQRPRAFRAAATACARNPIPIVVPCHRVVPAGGGIGNYGGGAGAQARAARARGRRSSCSVTLTDG